VNAVSCAEDQDRWSRKVCSTSDKAVDRCFQKVSAPVELVTISVTSGPVAVFQVALPEVQWVVYLNKCTSCTSARCCCGASSDLTGVCWEPPTIETIGTTDKRGTILTRKLKGAIGKLPVYSQNQVLPSAVECHKLRGRPHRCRGRPGHMVAQKSLSRTRGTSGPMAEGFTAPGSSQNLCFQKKFTAPAGNERCFKKVSTAAVKCTSAVGGGKCTNCTSVCRVLLLCQ
jgi:hypothetical protein